MVTIPSLTCRTALPGYPGGWRKSPRVSWAASRGRLFPATRPSMGVLPRRQGTRRPRGAQQFHHPFDIDHETGQQILDLDPPLAPIPAVPSPVVAYDIGQLAFDPGMLAPYRRIAGRRRTGAGRVIRGLIIILDDTAPLLLRERRQALGLQRTCRTVAPGK